jgi:hypothetical protein
VAGGRFGVLIYVIGPFAESPISREAQFTEFQLCWTGFHLSEIWASNAANEPGAAVAPVLPLPWAAAVSCFHSELAALATLSMVLIALAAARIGIILGLHELAMEQVGHTMTRHRMPIVGICILSSYKPHISRVRKMRSPRGNQNHIDDPDRLHTIRIKTAA